MARSKRVKVPVEDLNAHLQSMSALYEPEYSNGKRHVYMSRPMQKWIIVRRKGKFAHLEITDDCPCSTDT